MLVQKKCKDAGAEERLSQTRPEVSSREGAGTPPVSPSPLHLLTRTSTFLWTLDRNILPQCRRSLTLWYYIAMGWIVSFPNSGSPDPQQLSKLIHIWWGPGQQKATVSLEYLLSCPFSYIEFLLSEGLPGAKYCAKHLSCFISFTC